MRPYSNTANAEAKAATSDREPIASPPHHYIDRPVTDLSDLSGTRGAKKYLLGPMRDRSQ